MTENPEATAPNGHAVRSERSTRLLINAAGDLIAEGSYATMTLAMVGERAGYSRSLATARFGSKAKLLDALVDQIVTRWNLGTVIPRTEGEPGLEALTIVLSSVRDSYSKDPQSLRVLYALMFEALGPDEELRRRFREFHRDMRAQLAATIQRGIEDGSIIPVTDPVKESRFIMATLRGVGYQWRLDPDEFEPVAPLDMLIESTRARLGAVPRPAPAGQ